MTSIESNFSSLETSCSSALHVINNAIFQNMEEIMSTNNPIARRNVLKELQTNVEKLTDKNSVDDGSSEINLLIEILQGTNYNQDVNEKAHENMFYREDDHELLKLRISPLSFLLLDIVSDEDSSEICRERSALCLCHCFKSILSSLRPMEGKGPKSRLNKEFLRDFYKKYCSVLHSRFGFDKNSRLSSKISSREGRRDMKTYEDAEEIRLILIKITSDLLQLMECYCLEQIDVVTVKNRNMSYGGRHGYDTDLVHATGLVCQVLAKSSFLDPYPELKRESCSLVKYLAQVFPIVVKMNEEVLLNAIVGGCQHNENQDCEQISTTDCLVRHRHAKTRSLALETVAEIISCHGCLRKELKHAKICEGVELEAEVRQKIDDGLKPNGNTSLEERLVSHIIPRLEATVLFDHSSSVRSALMDTITVVFTKTLAFDPFITKMSDVFARLSVILLLGITDEVDIVKHQCLAHLNKCASVWMFSENVKCGIESSDAINRQFGNDFISVCADVCVGKYEFHASVRHLIELVGTSIVSILLNRLSDDVSIFSKKRYLEALSFVFEISLYFQNKGVLISLWTQQIVIQVVSRISDVLLESDDDEVTFQAAIFCVKAIGTVKQTRNLATISLIDALTNIQGEGVTADLCAEHEKPPVMLDSSLTLAVSNPDRCAPLLNIIAGLIQGWQSALSVDTTCNKYDQLYEELAKLTNSLSSQIILEGIHVSSSAALSLFSTCHAMVHFIADMISHDTNKSVWNDESNVVVRDIMWCCVNLLGCPNDFIPYEHVMKLLEFLSTISSEKDSVEDFLHSNFKFMVEKLVNDFETKWWQSGDKNLLVFDALIRISGNHSIGQNFDLIIPIFEKSLGNAIDSNVSHDVKQSKEKETKYFSTKIFFMALVESVVSRKSFQNHYIEPFAERLLHIVVIPNLVWQVGGMASALRKVSAAVLFSVLKGGCVSNLVLFNLSPRLLPVLKCSLTDDDSCMRELAVSSMGIIFDKLPAAGLGDDAIHQLYPELIKCLDDSNDSVRLLSCVTLENFLRSSPPSRFQGTAITYIVENLFVHLDDPDLTFKKKVYDVLCAALKVDPRKVVKCAKASLLSHTSRHYCDLLLKQAVE